MQIVFIFVTLLGSISRAEDTVLDIEIDSKTDVTNAQTVEINLKKMTYKIEPPSSQEQALANSMPSNEYESFIKTRSLFLTQAAKALQAMKYGFGIGVVTKNRLQYISEKKEANKLINLAKDFSPSLQADIYSTIAQAQAESDKIREIEKQKRLSTKSHEVIFNLLKLMDSQLWQQAPLVAHANEFGLVTAIGLEAEGGKNKSEDGQNKINGWGGLSDIGISVGFNTDEKSLAIQIFNDHEKFKSTQMPAVFIAGVVVKAGLYIANQDKDTMIHTGSSLYPPMAPAFSSWTSRNFFAGFSSGLTWPPSPLGDMMTYMNDLKQTVLIRITISPLLKGFVRVKSAALNGALLLAKDSVQNIKKYIQARIQKNQCAAILN